MDTLNFSQEISYKIKVVKIDCIRCFSNILDVYSELNEHIKIISSASWLASSDTGLEYHISFKLGLLDLFRDLTR